MGRRPWGRVASLVACALGGTVLVADAATPPIDSGAGGTLAAAVPVFEPPADAVSVTQTPDLTEPVIAASMAAADDAGAAAVLGDGFQLGMSDVLRNGAVVTASRGPGWRFPVSVNALPNAAISATMGRALSAAVRGSSVVMSSSSAAMHGVQIGDVIEVIANDGGVRQLSIALIVPDETIGGSEVLMNLDQSQSLGSAPSRVFIYGPRDRAALDAGLAARGIVSYNSQIRVRRTWDPPDPDSTIGLLHTKLLLGEPQYQMIPGSDNVNLDPDWVAAFIPANSGARLNGYVRNNCNTRIVADLQAALDEIDAAGLTAALRGANPNANVGNCFSPRFGRNTPSDFVGSLSRHTWAQAMDINTIANCQGCVPSMDCAIVRIFRAHDFAWGGNFPRTDGMHFEWVGTRRDTLQYPSRYCPNAPVAGASTHGAPPATATAGMSELFVDDSGNLD